MPLQTNSGDIRKPLRNGEAHAVRGAASSYEKLLLLAILVVVAAWIMFHVALMLVGTFG
jgi:hypothetical protein